MTDSPQKPATPGSSFPTTSQSVSQLLLGAATIPLLATLVAVKAANELLRDLGQLSEEVFRGDRLPLINQPTPNPASDSSSDQS